MAGETIQSLLGVMAQTTGTDKTGSIATGLGRPREASGQSGSGLSVLVDPLVAALDRRLSAFEQALASFAWPSGSDALYQSRLAVQDKQLAGKLVARVPSLDNFSNQTKFYSAGFDTSQPSGIAAGNYAFTLSMGTAQETVNVSVGSGDTWGTVLDSVGKAINGAALPAQADVIYQNSAFSSRPDLAAPGRVLAISVNPGNRDQAISLTDTSGHLLAKLGMAATSNPTTPATLGPYQVTGVQQAVASSVNSTPFDANAPAGLAMGRHDFSLTVSTNGVSNNPQTSYVSKVFDPNAATTLAPGTYTFTTRFGGVNQSFSLKVQSGWTWNDVLQGMAGAINGQAVWSSTSGSTGLPTGSAADSQPGLTARVESSPIPSTTTQGVFSDGAVLVVQTTDPYASKDLTLLDGAGSPLAALGLTQKLQGQPLSVTVQKNWTKRDLMEAMADVIGSSTLQVSASTSRQNFFSGAVPNQTISNDNGLGLNVSLSDLRIGRRMTLTDGPTGLLASLNMLSGIPGQDAKMNVNGTDMVSENNLFATDQGRLQFDLKSPFAETLPLSVVESADAVASAWSDVASNYNELQSFLNATKSSWSAGLRNAFAAPVAKQSGNLAQMGVSRSAKTGLLWTQSTPFMQQLLTNRDQMEQTLWSRPDGLIPAWQQTAAAVRQARLDSYLAPTSSLASPPDTVKTELDLEMKHRLVNLLG